MFGYSSCAINRNVERKARDHGAVERPTARGVVFLETSQRRHLGPSVLLQYGAAVCLVPCLGLLLLSLQFRVQAKKDQRAELCDALQEILGHPVVQENTRKCWTQICTASIYVVPLCVLYGIAYDCIAVLLFQIPAHFLHVPMALFLRVERIFILCEVL